MACDCHRMVFFKLLLLLLSLAKVIGDRVQLMNVPDKSSSTWEWSWSFSGTKPEWGHFNWLVGSQTAIGYTVCDVKPSGQPNTWLRSDVISVDNVRRIDITIQYSVRNCSALLSPPYCRHNFDLYAHQAAEIYKPEKIPDPYHSRNAYEKIGTLNPKVISYPKSGSAQNTETLSFETDPRSLYVYLALHYKGGCFVVYGMSVHYYRCPSMALSKSLIQLPRTISPAKGSAQVNGSCAQHAQPPMTNGDDLYGYCEADGKWSKNSYKGECLCEAGYEKVVLNSGSECKACPSGTYKSAVSNSSCITCPLHSKHENDRTKCKCETGFYRSETETILDNCTAPPSAPKYLVATFINATYVSIKWHAPSDLGGRSDLYYEPLECKQCNDKGTDCTKECSSKVQTFFKTLRNTSTLAEVKHLSAYTYYKFKVFAYNGVSQVAGKNKNVAKSAELVLRTNETTPGVPEITATKPLSSTSIFISWTVPEKNGVILYYHVTYYPVGQRSNAKAFNTTFTNATIKDLEEGKEYVFKIQAGTRLGLGQSGDKKLLLPPGKNIPIPFSWEILAGIVGAAGVFLILILILVIVCLHKKRRRYIRARAYSMDKLDGHKLYIDPSNYGNPMEALMSVAEEIDRKRIKLEKLIGGGEFAEVYRGTLSTCDAKPEIVAVKILKPKSSQKNRDDFIVEASIMGQFDHPNVIGLKGVVTRSPDTPMMIITEFMENGSLDHFLKNHDGHLTTLQLLGIARGVSHGMAYLSGMNFIHRDLAARNILVADNMAAKVADFGLSRELDDSEDNPDSEYQTQGGKIPIRWTAPEAIRYRKFSSASDVWSFGILVWEILAFGERPYWDWDNFQVMDRVDSGYRLPAPMNCPKAIHNLMLDCWDKEKICRPKFADIVQRVDDLIRSPEKMKNGFNSLHSANVNTYTNFHEVTSVEGWLNSINMVRYVDHFYNAGYKDLLIVKSLGEEDLTTIGIKLIGHRNKINKSIKAMNKHFESLESNSSETQAFI